MAVQGISHAFEKMKEMEEREKDMKEKLRFLDGLIALRERIHTDILVKPGSGPPIPAHRALLVSSLDHTFVGISRYKSWLILVRRAPQITFLLPGSLVKTRLCAISHLHV